MEGQELKDIRTRLGLTQEQLAEQLGVHWNSIARQERGEIGIRESQARLVRLLLEKSQPNPKERKVAANHVGCVEAQRS